MRVQKGEEEIFLFSCRATVGAFLPQGSDGGGGLSSREKRIGILSYPTYAYDKGIANFGRISAFGLWD